MVAGITRAGKSGGPPWSGLFPHHVRAALCGLPGDLDAVDVAAVIAYRPGHQPHGLVAHGDQSVGHLIELRQRARLCRRLWNAEGIGMQAVIGRQDHDVLGVVGGEGGWRADAGQRPLQLGGVAVPTGRAAGGGVGCGADVGGPADAGAAARRRADGGWRDELGRAEEACDLPVPLSCALAVPSRGKQNARSAPPSAPSEAAYAPYHNSMYLFTLPIRFT